MAAWEARLKAEEARLGQLSQELAGKRAEVEQGSEALAKDRKTAEAARKVG